MFPSSSRLVSLPCLFQVSWSYVTRCINIQDCYVFWVNWHFNHHEKSSLPLVTFFALKSTLSDMNMTAPALCWWVLIGRILLFMCLKNCLWLGGCRPFTLTVAAFTMRFLSINLLFVLPSSHPSLLPFSSLPVFFWINCCVWFPFYLLCWLISCNFCVNH